MTERSSILKDLKEFAITKDRYLTSNFAGRKTEIARISNWIRDVQNRHQDGVNKPAAGATMLIQGAPGAGKTSLIDKLKQDWIASAEEEIKFMDGSPNQGRLPSTPDVVSIDAEALNSPETLEADLRRVDQPQKAVHRLGSVFKGFQFLGFGVSFDIPDKLAEQVVRDASRPLVLFIDEIQNARTTGMPADFLNRMHSGNTEAPVIPVYAGLAHSPDVLIEAGLSRLSDGAVINLGRLSEEETRESVDKFFNTHGVIAASETKEHWKVLIWRESCGWPQHLHNTLRSVAEELILVQDGELEKVDPFATRRRSAARRAAYYSARISGELEGPDALLGRVLEEIGDVGEKKNRCTALIRSFNQPGNEYCSIPRGMEAEDFLDLMIAKGLLQQVDKPSDFYRVPIPSMRNWCVAAAAGPLHTETMKGDAESIRDCLKAGYDINARDARGRTPLHIAAEENWPEIAEMLLEFGADPQVRDYRNLNPAAAADPLSDTARLLKNRLLKLDSEEPN